MHGCFQSTHPFRHTNWCPAILTAKKLSHVFSKFYGGTKCQWEVIFLILVPKRCFQCKYTVQYVHIHPAAVRRRKSVVCLKKRLVSCSFGRSVDLALSKCSPVEMGLLLPTRRLSPVAGRVGVEPGPVGIRDHPPLYPGCCD